MTTAAEARALVRPVLERHPDLALVGRWLFLKPVHHVARAILIGPGYYKERLHPQWAVVNLFQVRTFFPLSWGEELLNPRSNYSRIWCITDTDVQLSLIEAIEEQALPKLRAIATLDDFFQFVANHTFWNHLYDWPGSKIIADVVGGNLDVARSICKDQIEQWSTDDPYYKDDDRAKYRRLRELCARLAADDRPGIVRLLYEWEAETVRNFKIEHIWEPTPFPLEQML